MYSKSGKIKTTLRKYGIDIRKTPRLNISRKYRIKRFVSGEVPILAEEYKKEIKKVGSGRSKVSES